jgi:Holliday junction resolvase-like predicted endonuclease
MPNGEMREKGRKNEDVVADFYRKQGYQVINRNDKGFPDLIVLKDKHILFFVESKALGVPLKQIQKENIPKLKNQGFETKVVEVKDEKVVRIT